MVRVKKEIYKSIGREEVREARINYPWNGPRLIKGGILDRIKRAFSFKKPHGEPYKSVWLEVQK